MICMWTVSTVVYQGDGVNSFFFGSMQIIIYQAPCNGMHFFLVLVSWLSISARDRLNVT